MPGPSNHSSDRGFASQPHAPGGEAAPRSRLGSVVDWFFLDRRSGRIVVAHAPNLALWLWIATAVSRRLVEAGSLVHELLGWAGAAALGWWAIDELVRGVNPWRRLLGLAGCVFVIVSTVSSLGL